MDDFSIYFRWGWDHIISREALDHILFISALTLVFRLAEWRNVLVLVTAFTVGHFLTLWLAVMDTIVVDTAWVEFLIPVTILITAAVNMISPGSPIRGRMHYLLALIFGLVHGLGYANAIRFSLSGEQSLVLPLLAFNMGLEIGQLFVVLTILLLGEIIRRYTKISGTLWIRSMSLIILVLSLNMAIGRIRNLM